MSERKVPLCRKCETRHFNVHSCERAAELREKKAAQEEQKRKKKVYVQWRNDGARTWQGDRLKSYEKVGNMHWRRREG